MSIRRRPRSPPRCWWTARTIAWIGDDDAAAALADDADEIVELDGAAGDPRFRRRARAPGDDRTCPRLGRSRSRALAGAGAGAARRITPQTPSGIRCSSPTAGTKPAGRSSVRHGSTRSIDASATVVAYIARVDSHSAVISSALLAQRPEIRQADGWSDDGRVERDAHHLARQVTHDLWSQTRSQGMPSREPSSTPPAGGSRRCTSSTHRISARSRLHRHR